MKKYFNFEQLVRISVLLFFTWINAVVFSQDSSIEQSKFILDESLPSEIKIDSIIVFANKSLKNNPALASEYAAEAYKLIDETIDPESKSKILFLIGKSQANLLNFDSAMVAFEQSLHVEQTLGNDTVISDILFELGKVNIARGENQQARKYLRQSVEFENELDRKEILIERMRSLGSVNHSLGDFHTALENFNRALVLAEKLKDKQKFADIKNNIGVVYFDLGDYEKALDNYMESLRMVEELDNLKGMASALNNIGIVYYDWGNKEKALEYYQKSLKIEEKLESRKGLADSFNNIGIIYSDWDQNSLAIDYYEKALEIYREIKDLQGISRILNNIGESYFALGDHQNALVSLQESLEMEKQLGNRLGVAQSYQTIGNVYFQLNDFDAALTYNNLSHQIADSCNISSVLLLNYELYYKIYKGKNQYQKALVYYQNYSRQKDSIYNKQFHDNIAELETKYEIDKMEKERVALINDFLKQENEIKNREREAFVQRIYLIIIFILMLIFGVLVYFDIKSKIRANNKLRVINDEITEQKEKLSEALDELSKSETKYKNLVKYSPTGIIYIDNKGKILEVNQKILQILGSPSEEATKEINCLDYPPLKRVGLSKDIITCQKTGKVIYNENWYESKWGKRVYLRYYVTPVVTRKGNVSSMIVNVEDITRSKEAEASREQSEMKYRMLVENSLQAMLIIQSGKLIFANSRVEDLTQYSTKELEEKGKNWLKLLIHRDDYIRAQQSVRDSLNGIVTPAKNEYRYIRKDGKVRWIESLGSIVQYHGKRAILVVAIDISDRKEAEDILIESREKLRKANAMKDKFFSIIAHDLKNPFNIILGSSNLLYEAYENLTENERKTFIRNICEASENTYKLLQNLLDWSGTQTGTIDFSPAEISIADLVKENVSVLKPIAENKEIKLTIGPISASHAFADKNMINTVIRNLLSNAIKFTPRKGQVKISVLNATDKVEVRIEDNGIGIEKKNLKRLFRIDDQYKSVGTEKEEGSGLGLILCREFIGKNNGAIWAESEKGIGSKFIFTIPRYT
ncbi:MAG: tetratricopeptide repeat protein [Bacteroidales bacterium]|nr:tetratricopeptide repeat protein [Bacteroidales bacterium]